MRIVKTRLIMMVVLSIAYLQCAQAQMPAPQTTPDYTPPDPELDIENLDRLNRTATDDRRGMGHLQAMKGGLKLIKDLQLPCELTDARQAGKGRTLIDGKAFNIDSYEVACSNGMGYILVSQDRKQSTAMSCFDAATTDDGANAGGHRHKRSIAVACRLPVNDAKAMATTLLTGLNANCTVAGVSSFGVNATNHTEYVEVACTGNVGYVLVIPQQTQAASQLSVMSCQDAARHGLQCSLTNNPAPAPVTMQTLYDALKQNGVSCTSAQLQLRMIGREATKKRYVVETRCPEQPGGLVAYIPLEDNTNKFETIDCNEALKRQITCQFTAK